MKNISTVHCQHNHHPSLSHRRKDVVKMLTVRNYCISSSVLSLSLLTIIVTFVTRCEAVAQLRSYHHRDNKAIHDMVISKENATALTSEVCSIDIFHMNYFAQTNINPVHCLKKYFPVFWSFLSRNCFWAQNGAESAEVRKEMLDVSDPSGTTEYVKNGTYTVSILLLILLY